MEAVILGAEGIFTALDWIDNGVPDDCVSKDRVADARAQLLTAGHALCKLASDRF